MLSRCYLFILPLYYFCVVACQRSGLPDEDPAIYYNMIELACSEGYYIQEHTVVTDDGYLLGTYRIPGGRRRPKVPKTRKHYLRVHEKHHPDFENCFRESLNETFKGPPILLVHGLTAASDCWILQGADKDLAFLLADRGYDVWFVNFRGNFYSKRHKTLRTSEKAFWDFSFHEIAVYDIANTIDYVLRHTGYRKLYYIGHSMGTTVFFVLASVKPEYQEKIILFIGLTPVAHIRRQSYTPSKIAVLNTITNIINAYNKMGVLQFLPRNDVTNFVTRLACTTRVPTWLQNLCYDFSFFFAGHSSKLYAREKLGVFLSHGFSGSSVKTFLHYIQLLDATYFQWFDYGPEENFRRYAQAEPPVYDLHLIHSPVAMFYSDGDHISASKDVENTIRQLPNVIMTQMFTGINHVDFLWAHNAKITIYGSILELLEKYGGE